MPSATITREPTTQPSDHDHELSEAAQGAFEWLARTARWQRRLDQLRAESA